MSTLGPAPHSRHCNDWQHRRAQYAMRGGMAKVGGDHEYSHQDPRVPGRHAATMSAQKPGRVLSMRWPPLPTVEDEAKSLSREQTPSLINDNVHMRGAVDQQPIILEADSAVKRPPPQVEETTQTAGRPSLNSNSSDESLGPETPKENNNERRFVYIPGVNSESSDEGELRAQYGEGSRSYSRAIQEARRPREIPVRNAEKVDDPVAATLRLPRQRTPYAFHAPPGEGKHFGDYLLSPDVASPNTNFPTYSPPFNAVPRGDHNDLRASNKERTTSSNAASMERPQFSRNRSSISRPGTPETVRSSGQRPLAPLASTRNRQRNTSRLRRSQRPQGHSDDWSSGSEFSEDEARQRSRTPRPSDRSSRTSSRSHGSRRSSPYRSLAEAARPVSRGKSMTPQPAVQKAATYQVLPGDSDKPWHQRHPSSESLPQDSRSARPSPSPSPLHSPYESLNSTPPPSPRLDQQSRTARRNRMPGEGRPSTPPPDLLPRSDTVAPKTESRKPALPPRGVISDAALRPSLTQPSSTQTRHSSSYTGQPPHLTSSSQAPDHFIPQPPLSRPAEATPRRVSPLPSPATGTFPQRPFSGTTPALPPRNSMPSATLTPTSARISEFPFPASPSEGKLSAPFFSTPKRPSSSGSMYRSPISNTFDHPQHPASPARRSFELPRDAPAASPRPTAIPSRAPPQLPPCPRPDFTTSHHDWATLPSAPDFDICPKCAQGVYDAGFGGAFIPTPARPAGHRTRCDLGNPWVRMAWLLVLQSGQAQRTDLVERVVTILATEPPCPESGGVMKRRCSQIYDPKVGTCVPGFDVCSACVRLTETLFPAMQGGIFRPSPPVAGLVRPCRLAASSPHFATYLDLLDEASRHAVAFRRPPDLTRFVALARRVAATPPCRRDDQFRGARWHTLPTLPDFTVCEACYLEVVVPQVARGSAVARTVDATPRVPLDAGSAKLSCQLYSERMRRVWAGACRWEDVEGLRQEVMRRVRKERELQRRLEESLGLPEERRAEQLRWLVEEWRKWE